MELGIIDELKGCGTKMRPSSRHCLGTYNQFLGSYPNWCLSEYTICKYLYCGSDSEYKNRRIEDIE
jgi:hypothetical protein